MWLRLNIPKKPNLSVDLMNCKNKIKINHLNVSFKLANKELFRQQKKLIFPFLLWLLQKKNNNNNKRKKVKKKDFSYPQTLCDNKLN